MPITRKYTRAVSNWSKASTGVLIFIWVPIAVTAEDGFCLRAVPGTGGSGTSMFMILVFGIVPGLVTGLIQLTFFQPRKYGLFSIAYSALPAIAFVIIKMLLMDSRGVRWGD